MIAARCFCGKGWNLPAEACTAGHRMTVEEVAIVTLRTALQEIVDSKSTNPGAWEIAKTALTKGPAR